MLRFPPMLLKINLPMCFRDLSVSQHSKHAIYLNEKTFIKYTAQRLAHNTFSSRVKLLEGGGAGTWNSAPGPLRCVASCPPISFRGFEKHEVLTTEVKGPYLWWSSDNPGRVTSLPRAEAICWKSSAPRGLRALLREGFLPPRQESG